MLVHGLLVESVDLRRLGGSTGGNDVLGDNFDRCQGAPGEKEIGPLRRKGACDSAADRASGSVDHRNLVLQHHLWFLTAPGWSHPPTPPAGSTWYRGRKLRPRPLPGLERSASTGAEWRHAERCEPCPGVDGASFGPEPRPPTGAPLRRTLGARWILEHLLRRLALLPTLPRWNGSRDQPNWGGATTSARSDCAK